MAAADAVVWGWHGIVARMALDVCWDLRACGWYALGGSARGGLPGVRGGLLAGDDVDEEVEHVGFGERGGDIATLKCAALVLLGVDPGTHRQLRDEDVAAFGEEDRRFSRDHLHFRVCLHHFLDAGQRQLVQFVVVRFGFEVGDDVLPVRG